MSEFTDAVRAARAAGRQAAVDGEPQHSNPHRAVGAGEAENRVLARMWDAGFVSADPLSVDYTS